MSTLAHEVRRGAYADSIVLMQLQSALAACPGIEDAGVVMATEANREILEASGLLPDDLPEAGANDLVVVVRAEDPDAATAALGRIDELMVRERVADDSEYRPRSLRGALANAPGARWVLVSVPGRWAADVAREALDGGRHVFLYSDNVSLEDEVALKEFAAGRGLLVLGPDCGTAIVGGAGLGFSNRVRRGAVGIVAASGTGLQSVACRVHELGAGVSHAFGTGGRDLSDAVRGRTTLQALEMLGGDRETEVVVLLSKPPSAAVATRVLERARTLGKPVIAAFTGATPPAEAFGELEFARSLEDAAVRAVARLGSVRPDPADRSPAPAPAATGWLRGLFSGGTLALETVLALRAVLTPLTSNLGVAGVGVLTGAALAGTDEPIEGHAVVDLGADEFTVGRAHPMIDPRLRLEWLERAAADPNVGTILLDVVLGDGAHPDPAGALAPGLAAARRRRDLEVVALVVGSDEDPQDRSAQVERLAAEGAIVAATVEEAAGRAVARAGAARAGDSQAIEPIDPAAGFVNVGVEIFGEALAAQGFDRVQVDWRPPAGGDERLERLLAAMR